ncbi:SMI1/KNR4 family protein [Burkholderia stagnalis]
MLSEWFRNGGVTDQVVSEMVREVRITLPEDYMDFLRKCNGGEGFVEGNYMMLWKAEDIVRFNKEYEVADCAQELLIFGSNGGGEAYAFDARVFPMPIVQIPFIGMDVADAIPVADCFSALFSRKRS